MFSTFHTCWEFKCSLLAKQYNTDKKIISALINETKYLNMYTLFSTGMLFWKSYSWASICFIPTKQKRQHQHNHAASLLPAKTSLNQKLTRCTTFFIIGLVEIKDNTSKNSVHKFACNATPHLLKLSIKVV